MQGLSDARRRILALHDRVIRFSTSINQSYPDGHVGYPSRVVWDQLVRAADGASNNLIEADAASSTADFLNKMRIALRETKEAKACLAKVRLGPLANAPHIRSLGVEQEADELSAIFATIIINTEKRLAREKHERLRR